MTDVTIRHILNILYQCLPYVFAFAVAMLYTIYFFFIELWFYESWMQLSTKSAKNTITLLRPRYAWIKL